MEISLYLIVFFSILIFTFLITFPKKSYEKEKLFFWVTFTILFLISALRGPQIGTDTANYIRGFKRISNAEYSNFFNVVRWEEGYVLFNKIISILSNSPQIIIIFTSLLILSCVFYFINRNSKNIIFSIYIFVTMFYYFASFNIIRQFLAIGIILIAYKFILERRIVPFAALILFASTFHGLAILFLPVYFLYGVKLNKLNTIIITFGVTFFVYFFEKILNIIFEFFPSYQWYVDTDYFEGGGILTSLISASILVFGFLIRQITKISKEYDFLLILTILSLLISLLSMKVSILNRFDYYFSVFNILFIPLAINSIEDKKTRIIIYYVVYCIAFLYFLARLIEGFHGVTPYNFFFRY
ncbi:MULTISPECIES: EpsG family protein [Allobacillus]|uniref:EpsG family protein n=1 Tax=Allobacillus TaxID=1400133 RepID=UPI0016434408|nr:EpsG family protein [Allobacillus salarius]